jgi:hypothetical protein
MNIGWHRWKNPETGSVWHTLIRDTKPLARVIRTGTTGVDNYPWEWYLEDGDAAKPGRKSTGVTDSMRSAKEAAEWALGL